MVARFNLHVQVTKIVYLQRFSIRNRLLRVCVLKATHNVILLPVQLFFFNSEHIELLKFKQVFIGNIKNTGIRSNRAKSSPLYKISWKEITTRTIISQYNNYYFYSLDAILKQIEFCLFFIIYVLKKVIKSIQFCADLHFF